ncbi:MAG: hypothetical protein EHJ95_07330, partial [Methanobacteriota archaeon]
GASGSVTLIGSVPGSTVISGGVASGGAASGGVASGGAASGGTASGASGKFGVINVSGVSLFAISPFCAFAAVAVNIIAKENTMKTHSIFCFLTNVSLSIYIHSRFC